MELPRRTRGVGRLRALHPSTGAGLPGAVKLSNQPTLLSPNYTKMFSVMHPFLVKVFSAEFPESPYLSSHCDMVMASRSRCCRGESGMDDN